MNALSSCARFVAVWSLVAGMLVALPATPALAAPDAVIDWRMPDRFGADSDGDGLVDYDRSAAHLDPSTWPVTLDACGSTPGEGATGIASYAWTLQVDGAPITHTTGACEYTHEFPDEGTYPVELAITTDTGETVTAARDVVVEDLLIVSVGDSIASGEGNPDVVAPAGTFPGWDATWQDERCHRSALAGTAQGALRLERRDPRTSVTFVHLACSGATVFEGLVGPYEGIVPSAPGTDPVVGGTGEDKDQIKPQLQQLAELPLGGRTLDALFVSIGANDLTFSEIVKRCLVTAACHGTGPDAVGGYNGQVVYDDKIATLNTGPKQFDSPVTGTALSTTGGAYGALAAVVDELVDSGTLPGDDRVFLTDYFDPTTGDDFDVSASHVLTKGDISTYGDEVGWCDVTDIGLRKDEAEWANAIVVTGLNAEVAAGATAHGWTLVEDIGTDFLTHGYCAADRWTRRLDDSFMVQGDQNGAFHPNSEGHRRGYAVRLDREAATVLGVGGAELPADAELDATAIASGLVSFTQLWDELDLLDEMHRVPALAAASGEISTFMSGVFTWLRDRQAEITAAAGQGVEHLEAWINDPDGNGDPSVDGEVAGVTIDLSGTVAPAMLSSTYQVQLHLDATRTDELPLDVQIPGLALGADSGLTATYGIEGDFALQVDALAPMGEQVAVLTQWQDLTEGTLDPATGDYTPTPTTHTSQIGVTYDITGDFDGGTTPATLGILDVVVSGTASSTGGLEIGFHDGPDDDNKLTVAEWTAASPEDIFTTTCTGAVELAATVTGTIPGAATPTSGTVTVEDADVCDGFDPATGADLDLGELGNFGRMTPANLVEGLAHLVTLLASLEASTGVQLPFVGDALSTVSEASDRLLAFLVEQEFVDPDADITELTLDPEAIGSFGIDELEAALEETFELDPSAFGLVYDPATDVLAFDLALGDDPAAQEVELVLDDLLRGAGLQALSPAADAPAGNTASASIDPAWGLDLGIGVDLGEVTPPQATDPVTGDPMVDEEGDPVVESEIAHRFMVRSGTEADPLLWLDATAAGNLELDGRIGFIEVAAHDQETADGATVPLLAPRGSDPHMASLWVAGAGDYVTLQEIAEGSGQPDSPLHATLSAQIPSTTLAVDASVLGTACADASVTFAMADVTDPATLDVSPDASFEDCLLAFDFDPNNPRKLFELITTALRNAADELAEMGASDPDSVVNQKLPLANTSIREMVTIVDDLVAELEALMLADEQQVLAELATALEQRLNGLLGLPADTDTLDVGFEAPTGSTPAAITLGFDFTACTQGHAQAGSCDTLLDLPEAPFSFAVDGDGVVGTSGNASVKLHYLADLLLEVGVELPTVTPADGLGALPTASGSATPFVVDTSHLTIDVDGAATGTFGAYVGPFRVDVGTTGDEVDAEIDAAVEFASGGTGARLPLGSPEFDAWLGDLLPTSLNGPDTIDCGLDPRDESQDGACANLPIYVGGAHIGDLGFWAPDLLDPGKAGDPWDSNMGDLMADLEAALPDIAWELFLQGLDALADQIDGFVQANQYDLELPLVGDAMSAGADLAQGVRQLRDTLDTLVDDLGDTLQPEAVATQVQTLVVDTFGPGQPDPALRLLRDVNDDGTIDAGDVTVTPMCDDGNPADTADDDDTTDEGDLSDGPTACVEMHEPAHLVDLSLRLSIGQGISGNLPIDFELPGLRLDANGGTVTAGGGWSVDIGMGVGKDAGFYLMTDPITPGDSGEVELGASFDLPATVDASLAFVPTRIAARSGADDGANLTMAADLTGGGSDARMSLADLAASSHAGGPNVDVGMCGGVTIDRDITVGGTASSDPLLQGLPAMDANFYLDWDLFDCETGLANPSTFGSTTPTIEFRNVRMDLGSFVNDFAGPVLDDIDRYIAPMRPVLDEIQKPVPVISDVYEIIGKTPAPRWLDLLDLIPDNDLTFVKRLVEMTSFAANLAGMAATTNTISFGSFAVSGEGATGAPAAPGADTEPGAPGSLLGAITPPTTPVPQQAASSITGYGQATKVNNGNDGDAGGGFTFPIFDEPTSAFQYLLGKDVELVRWDAGELKARYDLALAPIIIPVWYAPPVMVTITFGGFVQAQASLIIGYDTYGIRQALRVLQDPSTPPAIESLFSVIGSLFQGVYLDDYRNGVDVPEIVLSSGVSVSGAVGIPWVAEGGVTAGIEGKMEFNLDDADGKLRIEEILNRINLPLCLFQVDGVMSAYVELFVDVFFVVSERWRILDVELFRAADIFGSLCDSVEELPSIADDLGGGVVRLNMGPDRPTDVLPDDVGESFTVTQDGATTVVSAHGLTKRFTGVTEIRANAGLGDDAIRVDASVTVPTYVCLGAGADTFSGGSGRDTVRGDGGSAGAVSCASTGPAGQDQIVGNDGDDDLDGGGDEDTIRGGLGGDTLRGGDGADAIDGGRGPDTIHGGEGADVLNGGPDSTPGDPTASLVDTINGDGGNDRITGGFGDDILAGGADDDHVDGQLGNDTLDGDGGRDLLLGGHGNDVLRGGADADSLVGGKNDTPTDSDTLEGGSGADTLVGDDATVGQGTPPALTPAVIPNPAGAPAGVPGNDLLKGDAGDDTLYGQAGDDTLEGGGDDDLLLGDVGDDTLRGDGGADTLQGEVGNDILHGGAADDRLRGGQGADELHGEAGADDLAGGEGADHLFGGADADTLDGEGGNDHLEGNGNASGRDVLRGGAGDDRLVGGGPQADGPDGPDDLHGGLGHDVLLGDNAAFAADGSWPSCAALPAGAHGGDLLVGDGGDDVLVGQAGDDDIRGGLGNDILLGEGGADTLGGEAGHDAAVGDCGTVAVGSGLLPGGAPTWIVEMTHPGVAGTDTVDGGAGDDVLFGGPADDSVTGGDGDDRAEGNAGDDTVAGGAGNDDLVGGGAVAGAEDGRDVVRGGDGSDVVAGDNATIERNVTTGGQWQQSLVLGAPRRTVTLLGDAAGDDVLLGGVGRDAVYGQGGNDTIDGGADDDLAEGGPGDDAVQGGSGADDLIGGSSANDGRVTAAGRDGTGAPDGDDVLEGDPATAPMASARDDVIVGDNGRILRAVSDGALRPDPARDGPTRLVMLFDVEVLGGPAVAPDAIGTDTIRGVLGHDQLFGGGGDDVIDGGTGHDVIEGNAGADILAGGDDHDDLVGGGSADDGDVTSDDRTGQGLVDGDDSIDGGAGDDLVAGDNARVLRPAGVTLAGGFGWASDRARSSGVLDLVPQRAVTLFGVAVAGAPEVDDATFGDDAIDGGDGDDVIEGNSHTDDLRGGDGADDIAGGGSSAVGAVDDPARTGDGLLDGPDVIAAGDGADVVTGDNARILRPTSLAAGSWLTDVNRGDQAVRQVVLFDVATAAAPAQAGTAGPDVVEAGDDHDRVYGQDANDDLSGGGGDDVVEGGAGDDVIAGGDGADDLIGGGSSTQGAVDDPQRRGDGLLDGADQVAGGAGGDAIAGDNARIERPLQDDGLPQADPNRGGAARRDILLFDVQVQSAAGIVGLDGQPVPDGTSAADDLSGGDGRDRIHGQGGADGITGDGDDDVLEGNAGDDHLAGGAGQDDIVGGSSAGDGAVGDETAAPAVAPTNLVDGGDTIDAGDGADVGLGDNGQVLRRQDGGTWQTLGAVFGPQGSGYDDVLVRDTIIEEQAELAGAFGDDLQRGGAGHDVLVGQAGDDRVEGGAGDDGLVGDLGRIDLVLEDGTRAETLSTQAPFLSADVHVAGSLTRDTVLYAHTGDAAVVGVDTILGEDGDDRLHGGPGADLLNGDGDGTTAVPDPDTGTSDRDVVFGGDGSDAMWGGRGDDDLFGGHDDDHIDVFPRPTDPDSWRDIAGTDVFQGLDYAYGGWNQDAMQADVQETGPREADRLIDWVGAHNVYYVCEGAYGEGTITRSLAPQVQDFLWQLAQAHGAVGATQSGTSGYREVGMVLNKHARANSQPVHPDHPGHFTCNGTDVVTN